MLGWAPLSEQQAGLEQSLQAERAVVQQESSKRTVCASESGKSDVDNESPVSLTAQDTDTQREVVQGWGRS